MTNLRRIKRNDTVNVENCLRQRLHKIKHSLNANVEFLQLTMFLFFSFSTFRIPESFFTSPQPVLLRVLHHLPCRRYYSKIYFKLKKIMSKKLFIVILSFFLKFEIARLCYIFFKSQRTTLLDSTFQITLKSFTQQSVFFHLLSVDFLKF